MLAIKLGADEIMKTLLYDLFSSVTFDEVFEGLDTEGKNNIDSIWSRVKVSYVNRAGKLKIKI